MSLPIRNVPASQGLYDPQFEHDACGIGLIAHVKGERSHSLVQDALTILLNLDHRGAKGADPDTGDGAGILLQLPDRFIRQVVAPELDLSLPPFGAYGVGMFFMPHDEEKREAVQDHLAAIVREEGQKLLGWRQVPVDRSTLGETAQISTPDVWMVLIGAQNVADLVFERKLYKIRRRVVNAVRNVDRMRSEEFYVVSLSSRTIVYKGMLTPAQVAEFYPDLADERVDSAIALVHSRFSTNTFPNWARAHPYRLLMHNGEINTLRGNVNWLKARQAQLRSTYFANLEEIFPVIDEDGSDSAQFDNVLEFLTLNGLSLSHALMMMVPEPWQRHQQMDPARRAFYEYHACLMEPWDGPAALAVSDGTQVVATLDRNGLRPSRYYVTKDDRVILASEVGVLDIAPEDVVRKGRLEPGRMLIIDTAEQRIISDDELKSTLANAHPYQAWLNRHLITLDDLPPAPEERRRTRQLPLTQLQHAFGYSFEDLRILLTPMAAKGVEAIGSMGDDTPLAVLSTRPRLLYDYFKQLFAQVTNPPIDAIREELVTATETYLGSDGNMLDADPLNARRLKLPHPILNNEQLRQMRAIEVEGFRSATLPILTNPHLGGKGLEAALAYLCRVADRAIAAGANLLILSDRGVDRRQAAIPALLAVSALHHHLIANGDRTRVSLVLETGEAREVHHFCTLLGYGAEAINPYLAFETIGELLQKQMIVDLDYDSAIEKYIKAIVKGIVKVCSKMGISTVQSYGGAQIFEALGLNAELANRYFCGTPTRIEGANLEVIAGELLARHKAAFPDRPANGHVLPTGGLYQVREEGESHAYDPITVHALQHALRSGDYQQFKRYSSGVNDKERRCNTLRGLMQLRKVAEPLPLEEIEPVESILQRFKTGAMSYGSISLEAHATLAVAMNRIGGKSNTGEGGEAAWRFGAVAGKTAEDLDLHSETLFDHLQNGDSALSKIKQVASGRFGVTSEYLVNASEIQIKMAQGAKPGEGGQLPGHKVYPWIAETRMSTPGVGLISPPPHHDIYSIEDLAQLIFDLKNVNPQARINVKLVSEVGVGTIAAGVAKGHADVILISGTGGGTGAAPQTSIKHAGLPWELGLAETHQTLLLNDLRSRVRLETDGQLKTGRDVIIGALLGAEEFGFSTAPLIAIGCIMMRVCHLNTCPVGIATQNPELRRRFSGDPQSVVNFMTFIAEEVRELMAELGVRRFDDLIGRSDLLDTREAVEGWKARNVDLSNILYRPDVPATVERRQTIAQDHGIEQTFDYRVLLDLCRPALESGEQVRAELSIRNVNRTVGALLGGEISRRYGSAGLADGTIELQFNGTAGQSFGAFLPAGVTFMLAGDANDAFGKGLSGGRLAIYAPAGSTFDPAENIIAGNVALYGATGGEAYISGVAGERFAVRNSGALAVVEGVGDHGCEYMTGGRVVVIGRTGRNFAAGMSGGIAYVLDQDGSFGERVNGAMVDVEPLDDDDQQIVYEMLRNHVQYSDSRRAQSLLDDWRRTVQQFVRVVPRDYRRVLDAIGVAKRQGLDDRAASLAAFEANKLDRSRLAGN